MKTESKSRNQRGFTIIELMVGVVVAGVLLAIAVPTFNDFQARNALRSTSADFIAAVNTARIQAINLRTPWSSNRFQAMAG